MERTDLEPRTRLLAIFNASPLAEDAVARGCPFANAAVEIAALEHPVHRLVAAHKERFLRSLECVATKAGLADPELIARQLSILFDGVCTHTAVTGRDDAASAARATAAALIDAQSRHREGGDGA